MMRARLVARSARLVLAAAAVTALTATTTACNPEGADAAASATPSSAESTGDDGRPATDDSSAGDPGSGDAESSGPSGSSDEGAGTDDAKKDGYGQSCGTNDLDFTVTSKSEAGGYYLVTAKAKSGITCYLDVNTPSVSFGSGADGVASPVGQGGEDPVKLSGSTAAYVGIDPKTTDGDVGTQFENVIIALSEEDPDPVELVLPGAATVDKPITTGWAPSPANSVPIIV